MNKNLAIAASAGTGKTYNLAVRYIRLILNNASPDSIVALTFSRMAANEIFDRVITLLTEWINDYENFIKAASDHKLPKCSKDELIDTLCKLITSLHRLPVGTLDSFFINILGAFSIELGLPAGFKIIDDHELYLIREKILSKILNDANLSSKDVRNITDAYRLTTIAKDNKNVSETFFNFIKSYHETFILHSVDKMVDLFGGGYPFDECQDSMTECDDLLASVELQKESGKFSKRFFDKIITFITEAKKFKGGSFTEDKFLKEKLIPEYENLQEGECLILGYYSKKEYLPLNYDDAKSLARIIGSILNKYFEQNILMTNGIALLIKEYEKRYSSVRIGGKLTFDDVKLLLANGSSTFSSDNFGNEEKLYIDYRLDSKYKHWLLDEFQDTSRLQWKVIDNLIDEVIQDSSGEKSLFYVGDIKQAIYGWRNGDARLFNELIERYSSKDYSNPLTSSPLNKSYRSASEIMDLCNHVFTNGNLIKAGINPQFLKRWNWEEHSTNRVELNGYTEYFEFKDQKRTISNECLCKYISDKLDETDAFNRNLSVAVLVRSNTKGLEIYNGLRELGISADILANIGKVDSNAEKLIHSLIIYADHPGDTLALKHLEMSPLKKFINNQLSHNLSLMIMEEGYAKTVLHWVNLLKKNSELSEFSKFRLNDLIERSRRFDALGKKNSLEWQKYVSENPIPVKSEGKAVQIMTVHKSKGLQFDIVFLPQLKSQNSLLKPDINNRLIFGENDGWAIIPPPRDIASVDKKLRMAIREYEQDSFYESLCVLYVAMTRAKLALYMMGMKPPKKWNGTWHFETILRNTLSPLNQGKKESLEGDIVYSNGDNEWYKRVSAPAQKEDNVINIIKPLDIAAGKQGSAVSPSGQEKNSNNLSHLFSTQGSIYTDIGLAVHELFESINNLKDCNTDDVISKFKIEKNYGYKIIEDACEIFKISLQNEEVVSLLTLNENETCWNEKKITTVLNGNRITGIIDRLSVFRNSINEIVSARIVDYKTDNILSESDLSRSIEKYSPQLDLYKQMVSKFTGIVPESVSCNLLFVRNQQLVKV